MWIFDWKICDSTLTPTTKVGSGLISRLQRFPGCEEGNLRRYSQSVLLFGFQPSPFSHWRHAQQKQNPASAKSHRKAEVGGEEIPGGPSLFERKLLQKAPPLADVITGSSCFLNGLQLLYISSVNFSQFYMIDSVFFTFLEQVSSLRFSSVMNLFQPFCFGLMSLCREVISGVQGGAASSVLLRSHYWKCKINIISGFAYLHNSTLRSVQNISHLSKWRPDFQPSDII